MTEGIVNERGEYIGLLEWLPNGKVRGFSHYTGMCYVADSKDARKVVARVARAGQSPIARA